MTEEKQFEILHLSARLNDDKSKHRWFTFNMVIKAHDEDLYRDLMQRTQEYIPGELAPDRQLMEVYYDGLQMNFKSIPGSTYSTAEFTNDHGLEHEDVWVPGWVHNYTGNYLQHIEKFDVFRMYEYYEHNAITHGVVQYLQTLKQGKSKSRFADWGQLVRAMDTLNIWWD